MTATETMRHIMTGTVPDPSTDPTENSEARTYYRTPLEALEACWAEHAAAERAGNPPRMLEIDLNLFAKPGFFSYSAGYEAPFDRVGDGCAITFGDLTHEMRNLIAPHATAEWYMRTAVQRAGREPKVDFGPRARALFSSTWKRRTIPVRDLFGHVMTAWAIHHAWPSWNWESGYHEEMLSPGEYRGGYGRLMREGKEEREASLNDDNNSNDALDPPVIFLDGEIHTHAILYAAALLRFRPGGTVRVIEGTSGPADPLVLLATLPPGKDSFSVYSMRGPNPDEDLFIPFLYGKGEVSAKARRAWRRPRKFRAPGKFDLWLDRLSKTCLDFLEEHFPPRQQMSGEEIVAQVQARWGGEGDRLFEEKERAQKIEWSIDDGFLWGCPPPPLPPDNERIAWYRNSS